MSDTRWTAIAAGAHALAHLATTAIERRKPPSNDPALHERVAVLEEKFERLEANSQHADPKSGRVVPT